MMKEKKMSSRTAAPEARAAPPSNQQLDSNNNADDDEQAVIHHHKKPKRASSPPLLEGFVCSRCQHRRKRRTFASQQSLLQHEQNVHGIGGLASSLPTENGFTRRDSQKNDLGLQLPGKDHDSSHSQSDEVLWTRPLHVVYQDEDMAVVDKPQGMTVQGGNKGERTLMRSNLLLALLSKDRRYPWSLGKPRPVHRLDAGTGGLLVIAKTHQAERQLRRAFAKHDDSGLGSCRKQYRALVLGKLTVPSNDNRKSEQNGDTCIPNAVGETLASSSSLGSPRGRIDLPVSGGQGAVTEYSVCRHVRSGSSRDGFMTVVDLFPITGRKHQLRRHMKALGHSIVGDKRYRGLIAINNETVSPPASKDNDSSKSVIGIQGGVDDKGQTNSNGPVTSAPNTEAPSKAIPHHFSRLCLWAVRITLPHPTTGQELTFSLDGCSSSSDDQMATIADPEWLDFVIQQEEQLWREKEQQKHEQRKR